jgi:hypothetical protein
MGIRHEVFIYLFIYLNPKQHGEGNFWGQFFQKKIGHIWRILKKLKKKVKLF